MPERIALAIMAPWFVRVQDPTILSDVTSVKDLHEATSRLSSSCQVGANVIEFAKTPAEVYVLCVRQARGAEDCEAVSCKHRDDLVELLD